MNIISVICLMMYYDDVMIIYIHNIVNAVRIYKWNSLHNIRIQIVLDYLQLQNYNTDDEIIKLN